METVNFSDKLLRAVEEKQNSVCVGLDPRFSEIPFFIVQEQIKKYGKTLDAIGASIFHFNKKIIDAIANIVCVVKPQLAFYECYGIAGMKAFISTIQYAKKKGLLVIADGKRNDISSTAQAYAEGYLGEVDFFDQKKKIFDADALTITPYLGSDGILPFVEQCNRHGKGIFVLVKTSNKSSGEIQNLSMNKKYLYEHIANLVRNWGMLSQGSGTYSNVGAVVGATFPKEAALLRKIMPEQIFLVPGYGAQGATAKDVVHCFNKDRTGAIINASRSIIFACKNPKDDRFTEDVVQATLKMRDEILTA